MRSPLSSTRRSACQRTAPGEDLRLHVVADGRELGGSHRVVDAGDVLFDDRTLVEGRRHVVRGRADQLHAPLVGLVVRLGARRTRAGTSGGC